MNSSPSDAERASLAEGVRFAFGTLTLLPVRVTRWDRPAACRGMACAPLAGLVVGLVASAVATSLLVCGASALLAGVVAVAVPAVLTRGLHLDGLADVADGLGSGKPAEEALRIMKQSDIGPFGVVTLALVLMGQAAALASLYEAGWATGALGCAVAALTGRTALTLASREGVPAARSGGLGAAVAGAVPRSGALLVAGAVLVLAAVAGLPGPGTALGAGAAAALGLGASELLLRHCVRRFGGVTGDVFGALAETAATATLVALTVL